MANSLKKYLSEGIQGVLSGELDRMASLQTTLKKLVPWMKYDSFRVITLNGLPHLLHDVNQHLNSVSRQVQSVHNVARQYNDMLFSSEWEEVAEKINELTVTLRKIEKACPNVKSERNLNELITDWNNWALDFQEMVDAYYEAVGDFEAQIQEVF